MWSALRHDFEQATHLAIAKHDLAYHHHAAVSWVLETPRGTILQELGLWVSSRIATYPRRVHPGSVGRDIAQPYIWPRLITFSCLLGVVRHDQTAAGRTVRLPALR